MFLEGHGEKGIQGAIIRGGKKLGFPNVIITKTEAEEIAQGSLYARRGFAVPIHAQDKLFEMVRLRVVEREPDVREHRGTFRIEHRQRCAGFDDAKIGIASCRVGAGYALESVG